LRSRHRNHSFCSDSNFCQCFPLFLLLPRFSLSFHLRSGLYAFLRCARRLLTPHLNPFDVTSHPLREGGRGLRRFRPLIPRPTIVHPHPGSPAPRSAGVATTPTSASAPQRHPTTHGEGTAGAFRQHPPPSPLLATKGPAHDHATDTESEGPLSHQEPAPRVPRSLTAPPGQRH